MTAPLTREELLALPMTTDLITTGRALGVSEPTIRNMHRSGELEQLGIRVFRVGRTFRVVTSSIVKALVGEYEHAATPGISPGADQQGPWSGPTPTNSSQKEKADDLQETT